MPLVLAPTTLPSGVKGSAYSQTIVASGGTAPYSYAVSSGTLPAGLALNASTGAFTGTPTTIGTSNFTITATDATASTVAQAYTFSVAGGIYWFICSRAAYPPNVPTVAANQGDFNRRTANAIGGMLKSRRNVGDLLARPTGSPIRDHILCDGSALSRTAYPQLFAEIGTEWGSGDGSTTFNVPNLIATTLPTATTAPPQTITNSTVTNDPAVVEPTQPGETGGTESAEVPTGGRPYRIGEAIP